MQEPLKIKLIDIPLWMLVFFIFSLTFHVLAIRDITRLEKRVAAAEELRTR